MQYIARKKKPDVQREQEHWQEVHSNLLAVQRMHTTANDSSFVQRKDKKRKRNYSARDVQEKAYLIVLIDPRVKETILQLQQIDEPLLMEFMKPGGKYLPHIKFREMFTPASTPEDYGAMKHKVIKMQDDNPKLSSAVSFYLHELQHYIDIWLFSKSGRKRGMFQGRDERSSGVYGFPLSSPAQVLAAGEWVTQLNNETIRDLKKPATKAEGAKMKELRRQYDEWKNNTDVNKPTEEEFFDSIHEQIANGFDMPDGEHVKGAQEHYARWGAKTQSDYSITTEAVEMGYVFQKQAFGFYDPADPSGEWAEDFDEKFLRRYFFLFPEEKVQLKSLSVSDPQNADEKEADDIAAKVVSGQNAEVKTTSDSVNRSGEGNMEVTPDFQSQLNSSKGSGQSLNDTTRSEMESKMGADFSGVKVHTDSNASSMSESINAKAFTHGQDVYFGSGHTPGNKELLAHELVHTVQQSEGKVQPKIQRTVWDKEAQALIVKHTRNGIVDSNSLGAELTKLVREKKYDLVLTVLKKLTGVDKANSLVIMYYGLTWEEMQALDHSFIYNIYYMIEPYVPKDNMYDNLVQLYYYKTKRQLTKLADRSNVALTVNDWFKQYEDTLASEKDQKKKHVPSSCFIAPGLADKIEKNRNDKKRFADASVFAFSTKAGENRKNSKLGLTEVKGADVRDLDKDKNTSEIVVKGYQYLGKDPSTSLNLTGQDNVIWKELASEGGLSSINTYDDQIFTYGKGFAGPSFAARILQNLVKVDAGYATKLLEIGMYFASNSFVIVDIRPGKNYGRILEGQDALDYLQFDTRLLSFFIDLGENAKTSGDMLKAQWLTVKDGAGTIPAYASGWSDEAICMAAHLSHWLSGATWNGKGDPYSDTGGDVLKIIAKFFMLGYSRNMKVNGHKVATKLDNGAIKVNTYFAPIDHVRAIGKGVGNKGFGVTEIETVSELYAIPSDILKDTPEFKDFLFLSDNGSDYYVLPQSSSSSSATVKSIFKPALDSAVAAQNKTKNKSLNISGPQDPDEKEADSVAQKVVNGETSEIHGSGNVINRSGQGRSETTPEFQYKLESSKGSGQSLEDSTRSEMESKMGSDFSGVKVHTGSEANQMSESVNARAFTHGQDIYFKNGQHDTSSNEGKELLAHELVHTVQQSGGAMRKIQRVEDPKEATGLIAQYRDGLLTLKEFVSKCVSLLQANKDSVLITILGKLSYKEGKNVAIILYEDYLKVDPNSINLVTMPLAKKLLTTLQDYLKLEGENSLSAPQLQLCKDMIAFLELKTANETKDATPAADPYMVVIDGTSVKVTLTIPGKTVTTKEKSISLQSIRDYLTTEYNWNALIRIMKFLDNEYDNPDNFVYTYPTSIKGAKDDSKVVLPNEGLKYLVKRQAKAAVSGKTISATNADSILKVINGQADGSFAKLMGLADMNALRNESTNTDKKDIYNNEIAALDFTKDEATIYDTLRSLVITRNGMWSDTNKVINMIAIRRKMGTTESSTTDPQAEFNDTIAIAWREPSGTNFVKRVRHFMATTMSGDMDAYRNIVPSTVTIKPGTHASKAPVFRTEKILTDKGGTKKFDKTDANGINIHMGSNEFSSWGKHNMSESLPASLASIGIDNETGFQAWLILAKTVGLVHKWNLKDDISGYDTMVELDKGKVTFDSSDATSFVVKQSSETSSYTMASARSSTVGHWLTKKGGRTKIADILAFADNTFSQPANFSKMSQTELEGLFTNERIVAIVKQQAKYAIKKSEANGQAKDNFVKIMNGEYVEITDTLVSDAKTDKATFDQLMTDSAQYAQFSDNLRTYIKGIKGTLESERKYMKNQGSLTKSPSKTPTSDYNVGGWSVACQVILGNGQFYEFQMQTLAFVNETGQRRWYYTLLDESSIKVPQTAQGTVGN